MQRPSGRAPDDLRPIRFTRRYTKHAEGSVLVADPLRILDCSPITDGAAAATVRDELEKAQGAVASA